MQKPSRVLLYDVEITPNLAYVWGKYEQNVVGEFVRERQIISFAWKWLDEKQVYVLSLPMLKSYKKDPWDNKGLIRVLYQLFCEADVVVGQNVDRFDDKVANTEFITHGFPPPPKHSTVDTLKVAKKYFRFNSNKLNDLGQSLGVGKKVETGGFKLWLGCMRGDIKSWQLMEKYNKQDVVLLEKVYLKLRPWINNHPDMNALDRLSGCPTCKSRRIQLRGWERRGKSRVRRYACMGCGRWFQGKPETFGS